MNHDSLCGRALLVVAASLASCASSGNGGDMQSTSLGTVPNAARGAFFGTDNQAIDIGHSLSEGRQVALVFWQPWCPTCKGEVPAVAGAAKAFRGQMDVFGVVSGPDESTDQAELDAALADWGITYPSIRDRDLTLTDALDVAGVPTIIILNPDGTVAYRSEAPPAEWENAAMGAAH